MGRRMEKSYKVGNTGSELFREFGGMGGFNVREARKISRVEGENALYAVDVHGGGDAGIVDLDPGDGVSNEEPAPDLMHGGIVGEHWDLVFDHSRSPVGFRGRQAEAVAIQRPCQNVPELAQVLRCVTGKCARPNKRIDSAINQWLQGVIGLEPTYKNVAVEQYSHSRPMGDRRICLPELVRSLGDAAGVPILIVARRASYGILRP